MIKYVYAQNNILPSKILEYLTTFDFFSGANTQIMQLSECWNWNLKQNLSEFTISIGLPFEICQFCPLPFITHNWISNTCVLLWDNIPSYPFIFIFNKYS